MRTWLGSSVVFLFMLAVPAEAATLYMNPSQFELNRGDNAVVSVRLDVDDGECVNVIDGVISYSDTIEPVDISRGDSILSVWVEDPVINRENQTITFAGGIPNGYCGRIAGDPRLTNNIIDIVVASPGFVIGGAESNNATPTAALSFAAETKAYLNDGSGNTASLRTYDSAITLLPTTGSTIRSDWQAEVAADTEPPNPFSITLERSDNAFSGDYFITFNTTDKQTGIDHYEVIEEPLEEFGVFSWGAETAPWREVRSPYVVRDQTLNSTIRVRAIDKAGNEYVATLVPDESQRTMRTETYVLIALLTVAIGVVLGGVAFVAMRWYRRRSTQSRQREQKKSEEQVQDEEETDSTYDND